MKALLLKEPHVAEVIEVDQPEPGPGEVRIKVLCTGICGSEVGAWHGVHFARIPPVITGHEVCGLVDKAGAGVDPAKLGQRVAALPQQSCGKCEWCKTGQPNLCKQRTMLGFPAWQGSFAEYFLIPADLVYPLEDNVPDTVGTLMEPLAVAVHAVRRAQVKPGDAVVVFGSGAIGLMTVVAARDAGATTIIATDISDYNLDLAKKLGATHIINARSSSTVETILEITSGIGANAAIMAAEAPGLVHDALHSMKIQGSIVVVASYHEDTPINLQFLKSRELQLTGSVTYNRGDFETAVALASKYQEDLTHAITHVFPLEQGVEAFELASGKRGDHARVAFRVFEQPARK